MAWTWRYLDASGGAVDGPDEEFDDRAEAESWFGDTWPDLRASGVHAVVLLDGTREVYGPMGLEEG